MELKPGALYENEYVKENGRWRIKTLLYRPMWHCAFDRGWDKTPIDWIPFYKGPKYPESPYGPDIVEEPGQDNLWLWPDSTSHKKTFIDFSSCFAFPLS